MNEIKGFNDGIRDEQLLTSARRLVRAVQALRIQLIAELVWSRTRLRIGVRISGHCAQESSGLSALIYDTRGE